MKPNNPPSFALPKRYRFANKTLAGGQGAVYLCEDKFLERTVAVKSLHSSSDPAALLKEIAARGKIQSKHVAEIYECISDPDGKPTALVLEYVPGESLFDKALHPKTLEGKILLLYQIASGIADIHAAKVIHRDIKPQNMKVDEAGILKIFDLGIANIDADDASTVGAAGTAVFRAPELYKTLPAKVTPAADVYALGIMAWFLLSSKFPSVLLEKPPQSSGAPLPSIVSVVPDLGRVATRIDRALKLDPAIRPTAARIRDALASRISFGKRRGVLNHNGKIYEVSAPGTSTMFRIPEFGSLRIDYDGDRFTVGKVEGAVYINNTTAKQGDELPNSCVITYGAPSRGSSRVFVPFNASQPEIVL